MQKASRRIYLDYAASTPVDSAVLRAMQPYYGMQFGNAGSLHAFGQAAIAAVDRAREIIADEIGAGFREVIFTGSATEANNLALRGAVFGALKNHKELFDQQPPRIIISSVEHESILETARMLEDEGIEVVRLPVDRCGVVDLDVLEQSIDERTVLISVLYAQNEIGTIQSMNKIAALVSKKRRGLYPVLHSDASQALQFLNCNVDELGLDLMTISSHKLYGPKGAAALYIRHQGNVGRGARYIPVAPIIFGGGQEFGFRSGTENIPAIVGFASAVQYAAERRGKEWKRVEILRNGLWRGIRGIDLNAAWNGRDGSRGAPRGNLMLPNMLNVYFPWHQAQDLLTRFDRQGLAVSSGSACRSRALEASYVIRALGYSESRARASIRFSLGRFTAAKDIEKTLDIIRLALRPQVR